MIIRKYPFYLGLLLVLVAAGVLAFLMMQKPKDGLPVNTNVNVASSFTQPTCKWIDEPWPPAVFRTGQYENSSFGYRLAVPTGMYLQTDMHTQEACVPDNPMFASTSFATFGDDNPRWSIQVQSYTNPKSQTLQAWVAETLHYEVTFQQKEFGTVTSMYAERTPLDISDDDYQNIAVVQTGKFIQIITYHDKDSGMPRQADFEKLVASVKAYSGESVSKAPIPKPDTQASFNSTTDLYTSPALGFSMQIPNSWHVRTTKDSTKDVQYSDFTRAVESTPKPLYYSDGVAPQYENQVSEDGSAIDIGRSVYYNSKFSDYLDAAFQKDSYHQRAATIGDGIKATRVETFGYTTKYDYEYVVLHGEYVYTLSVRTQNPADEVTISTMLKSFKLL